MGLWKLLGLTQAIKPYHTELEKKLSTHFPQLSDENRAILVACSGLLAKTAFSDGRIDEKESRFMMNSLAPLLDNEEERARAVTEMAIENAKDLAGLEDYKYTEILAKNWSEEKRFAFLQTLFALAAIDGQVDIIESEDLRPVAKGLLLGHKHFTAARAGVKDYISELKNKT